jgi:hypothetical protein
MVFGLFGCPVFIFQVVRFNGATINYFCVTLSVKLEHKVGASDVQEIV